MNKRENFKMSGFIRVAEDEGEDIIEIPVEGDDTLLLSTLAAQFSGACGLKYRHPTTKTLRGVRLVEERLIAPDEGWDFDFFCSFPKTDGKRKSSDLLESSTYKTKRMDVYRKCSDLIVLGLPWKTTEEELKEYFSVYGDVIMAQIKKDSKTGQSRGYGFIRFDDYDAQKRVLSSRHVIDGRTCDVKIPNSKDGGSMQHSGKVFVGRTTEDLSSDDLREYFEKFGDVTDVFIPKPFRAFAFVTFAEPETAQLLCGEDHIIKGVSVNISSATPKGESGRGSNFGNRGGQSYGSNWSGNQGGRGNWGNNRGAPSGSGPNWNQQNQGSNPVWNNQGNNQMAAPWNNNYPGSGGNNNAGMGDMGGFDPKNQLNMSALTVPIMAALSQQLLGNMSNMMPQNPQQQPQQQQQPPQQMMDQQQYNGSNTNTYPPQQGNNALMPNTNASSVGGGGSGSGGTGNWNNQPRQDRYNRHSFHDGKQESY